MNGRELTCRELIEFLDDYLEDALAGEVRARFDSHLDECPDCVRYLASYRETMRLEAVALAPAGPPPEDVPEELLRAVLSARRR